MIHFWCQLSWYVECLDTWLSIVLSAPVGAAQGEGPMWVTVTWKVDCKVGRGGFIAQEVEWGKFCSCSSSCAGMLVLACLWTRTHTTDAPGSWALWQGLNSPLDLCLQIAWGMSWDVSASIMVWTKSLKHLCLPLPLPCLSCSPFPSLFFSHQSLTSVVVGIILISANICEPWVSLEQGPLAFDLAPILAQMMSLCIWRLYRGDLQGTWEGVSMLCM